MFTAGFQSFAFQTVGNGGVPTPQVSGLGYDGRLPYQRHREEEYQREKIRRQKSELERLDSVLKETKRKAALAEESRLLADKKNAKRLAQLEQEFLNEITRLLAVRVEIMARIKRNEQMLILMMAVRRKRFRASTWQQIIVAKK
jgi:hypothetical protein